jgi:hypothetical protein
VRLRSASFKQAGLKGARPACLRYHSYHPPRPPVTLSLPPSRRRPHAQNHRRAGPGRVLRRLQRRQCTQRGMHIAGCPLTAAAGEDARRAEEAMLLLTKEKRKERARVRLPTPANIWSPSSGSAAMHVIAVAPRGVGAPEAAVAQSPRLFRMYRQADAVFIIRGKRRVGAIRAPSRHLQQDCGKRAQKRAPGGRARSGWESSDFGETCGAKTLSQ